MMKQTKTKTLSKTPHTTTQDIIRTNGQPNKCQIF